MRILAVGGGSGGHVTPVVAVIREIKKIHPRAEIQFWCDNKFINQARSVINCYDKRIPVHKIIAGKFRRYHHLTILRQLLWPSLVWANIKDFVLVVIGFFQSLYKLIVWRPDVMFAKGGYVCLPVGFAAHLLRIPLVIHDSDAHPGLTNRILSKWATFIATGAPLDYYSYPKDKAKYVGIPINEDFRPFSDAEKKIAKQKWGIDFTYPLVVVTGGGLGASRINDTIVAVIDDLMNVCSVVLISGVGQYDELKQLLPDNSNRFQLHSFISEGMSGLLGASDLVVTRAGATTILELAALAKPTILIPNAKLTGGHQLKNAAVYYDKGAVEIVDEDEMMNNPQLLIKAINEILEDSNKIKSMSASIKKFSRPDAAKDVANMIISCKN